MSPIAILFGALLSALGVGLYFASESRSITALIPAFFGIALIVLGLIARNEKARKHAMHFAALLGLVGMAMPAYRVIRAVASGAEMNLALWGQAGMAVLCGLFLVLCIRSFIAARRARKE